MGVRRLPLTIVCLALVSAGIALNFHSFGSRGSAAQRVGFNRDIRPILNQNCMSCHGGVKQQGNVSFIYREQALGKGKSGRPIVVPGKPNASELIARVTSKDPEARMPFHAAPLQPKQIALLTEWIRQGAPWEEYWAFVPPKPQPLPAVKRVDWIKQPLDRFILAQLEKAGLAPSPEADKAALLRRVSFDLTGLPPTREELSAFLADSSPNAYQKQVDRLLASPHYGERWAAMWLDLARYADTQGYEADMNRTTWPYRDWVIDAFNRNLSYDRFVITQLAGDLFPDATLENQIATSFQRQTPQNDEAGTDDEEFRLAAVMDRVATTWSVLNGLTMNCVQCHSHPYDPIRHVEYYNFLAFYNTSRDADLDGETYGDMPTVPVPEDSARRGEIARLQRQRAGLLRDVVVKGRQLAEQTRWTPLPIKTGRADVVPALEHYLADLKLQRENPRPGVLDQESMKSFRKHLDEEIGKATAGLRRARKSTQTTPLKIVRGQALQVGTVPLQSAFELRTGSTPAGVTALRIEVPPEDPNKARHSPEHGFIVDRVDAWAVAPNGAQTKIEFRYFVPDSEENLANGLKVNDKNAAVHCGGMGGFSANSKLFQTRWMIAIPESALTLEPGSHLKVQLTHTKDVGAKPGAVKRVGLDTSDEEHWTALANDADLSKDLVELAELDDRLAQIPSVFVPVMAEQADYERRHTLQFERGSFLTQTGPALSADVPGLFPRLPDRVPQDRLAMAQWFFAPGQPLTARVAVNRYWEQLFGTGIVETLEDFGSAGQPPSHPELLDWLALHFQNDLRWNMKALLRELVTSAAYRQSAKVTPVLLEKDPRNRLVTRGPQQRLTAEMVRDQALAAGGLLNRATGGPPVMPPQPAGVWMTVYNESKWIDATGPERYRRAVYTFLKRAAIYPSFVTFDAADHVVSLPRRIPTNTPLQALVTLNDPVYQEAAEALARRMSTIRGNSNADTLEARLNYGAERVLSRTLTAGELTVLKAVYDDVRKMKTAPAATNDLATLTAIASMLLNFDAALTR